METKVINIARDFSRSPAGRYISDGPNSGEKFRKEFLIPSIRACRRLIVEMDGTRGYGSSFLEEAFGGLRRAGFARDELMSKIQIVSSDKSLGAEIHSYWQ